MDHLYSCNDNFIVCLDSRNATYYNNSSFNSDVEFLLESPIRRDPHLIQMNVSLLSFTSPNSIYIINEYNNVFNYSIGASNYSINFVKGNYNVNTFMAQFLTQMQAGFTITYNNITNQFTLGYTSAFSIRVGSTIYEIMGFANNTVYTSITNFIICPFTCNFNGLGNINIWFDTINTNNIESFTKSTSSVIQPVTIISGSSQIIFQKTTSLSYDVSIDIIDSISISIKDDLNNYVNFNNCHWNMTLLFTTIKDIDRFHESFHSILNYA